ncbi:MAG: class I SAM-dependent methyltransferase [Kiritimatiellae bacterium]|nr:class I SAM-dependent methyltransferase [Kiritimatiellia bacterium]
MNADTIAVCTPRIIPAKARDRVANKYRDDVVVGRYDTSRYNHFRGRLNNWAAWRALRQALSHVAPGGRLLDIPCGTGRFSWHFSRAGWQTTAVDCSEQMLAAARRAGAASEANAPAFAQGDVFRLPYPDRHFDVAVCVRLFNLLERDDRLAALRELARVSKTVVASYYHPYTLKSASRWIRYRLGLRHAPGRRLTMRALKEEIAASGLVPQRRLWVAPLFSEEWLVVFRHASAGPAGGATQP